MTILFSPIGTADPVSLLGDGPMLHIVRYCKPDCVVLFLSPRMAQYEKDDHRYSRSIELLASEENQACPDIRLVFSEYEEVYKFDHYIKEFEDELLALGGRSCKEAILLNGSSGTPAMSQALASLSAFGWLNVRLLQVKTPRHDVNERSDRENPNKYDFETLWELNPDRTADCENRIAEVASANFSDRLLRENVALLVDRFDYEAAADMMESIRSVDPHAIQLARAAADRLNLVNGMYSNVFEKMGIPPRRRDHVAEHLSVMEVRLEQGHYGEFIRLVTPVLTELAKSRLEPFLPRDAYLRRVNGEYTDELFYEKINVDDRLRRTLGVSSRHHPTFISNGMLVRLVKEYCSNDNVKATFLALREVEENARHRLAHTIASSGKADIESAIGMTLDEVFDLLCVLHGHVQKGLYTQIARKIKDLIAG